jgi:hypothetical protein
MIYRKNLPTLERWARLATALALGAFGAAEAWSTAFGFALIGAGVALGLTAFFGFCPFCAMIGRGAKG